MFFLQTETFSLRKRWIGFSMASFKDCVLFAHRLLSRSRVFLALTWLLLVCTVIVRYFVDYCECVREYVDAHARVCV